jgi:flagellar operon protein
MSGGPFLYPNVTSLPGQSGVAPAERGGPKKQEGVPGEFDKVFDQALEKSGLDKDLGQIKNPLKFSAHATQRLNDRKIALDPKTLAKVNEAVDKAEAKGVEDTLVLTKDAALIVSVKNRTVITALDKSQLNGNVFTNIDGAVVI